MKYKTKRTEEKWKAGQCTCTKAVNKIAVPGLASHNLASLHLGYDYCVTNIMPLQERLIQICSSETLTKGL